MYIQFDLCSLYIQFDQSIEFGRVVSCAGQRGHILNLGHGVLVGTPEEAVAHFFEVARNMKFNTTIGDGAVQESKLVA